MAFYKIYDPNNSPVYFKSLTDLRQTLELSTEEIKRVARAKNVAVLDSGDKVIIYQS